VSARPAGTRPLKRRGRLGTASAATVVVVGVTVSVQAADEITGRVIRVTSGDTVEVAADTGPIEIRLADIGAPQGGQYYASAARTLLSNIVMDTDVRLALTGHDGPKRVFGRVFAGDLDVNLELVRRGAAWVCLVYATDTELIPYENDAIRWRRGLWAQTTQFDARVACSKRPPAERPVGNQ
jgi:endonuclease YncB( thermonuclease family)